MSMEPTDCRKIPSTDLSATRIVSTPHTRAGLGTKPRHGICGTTRYKPDGRSETNPARGERVTLRPDSRTAGRPKESLLARKVPAHLPAARPRETQAPLTGECSE